MRLPHGGVHPEAEFQRRTAAILRGIPRMIAWHTPNGGYRTPMEAAKLQGQGVKAGVPDWTVIWKGQTSFIELKVGSNKLSKEQEEFRKDVERQGLKYYVVWTEKAFMEALQRIMDGVPR